MVGDETLAEDDEEEDEEEDEEAEDEADCELLASVDLPELAVPDAAAVCCAAAGKATAIAAAAAALSTPAPAVIAASLVLPRRRVRRALARWAPSDSCSVVMIALRFLLQIGSTTFRLTAPDQGHVPEA